MKKVVALCLFAVLFQADDISYKGYFGLEYDYFSHNSTDKREDAFALRGEIEAKKEIGAAQINVKLKGVSSFSDSKRRFIDFSELYYKYNLEDSEVLIGRNILFWGALEVYNVVDVFNAKDILDDPFDYERKLGSWNVAYTQFFDNSEFSVILRLDEENQKMQDKVSVFNFLPLPYDSDLKTQYNNRPSLFVKYSGLGETIQIDYAVIYEAGYDSQRYVTYNDGKLRQNAYWVNKLMGFSTLIVEDTIYKAEASFAISDDVKVADYLHAGVGLEHTFYGVYDKSDVGLLVEYYRYEQMHDMKFTANELGQFFQNDLYLGGRFSFNDIASSEILVGVDFDLDNDGQMWFTKYDTRILDNYKFSIQYQHLSLKEDSWFEKLDHIKLAVSYYF